jgi:hypothetical protein
VGAYEYDFGPDSTSPIIEAVDTTIVTGTRATIRWQTDEVADAQVEYGTTASYGSTSALDPTLLETHSATIRGLLPGTLYHFRVISADATGNLSVSTDATFSTLPPDS